MKKKDTIKKTKTTLKRFSTAKEIYRKARRLKRGGSERKNQGSFIRTVMENNVVGKRSLGRPCLRICDLIVLSEM